MTRKRRRLYMVLAAMSVLGIAAALVLTALEENIVFFYSPTDILTKQIPEGRRIRLGGLVEAGSVKRETEGVTVRFTVSDLKNRINVTYRGVLPDLFREGQGVVAEGRLDSKGGFAADEVLAKHDENYMPKEVAEALKKSGLWKHTEGEPTK